MRQEEFEKQYELCWKRSALIIELYDKRSKQGALDNKLLDEFPALYRKLCHSLAVAKERQYSPFLVERLDRLALRGHQILYQRRWGLGKKVLNFVFHGFARKVQDNARLFWLTSFIFYGPALIMFALTIVSPELIYSLLPPSEVASFEAMYDPSSGAIGRERESDTDVRMFGHYIQNNIGIAFRTFAAGIFFTLGSLFFLIFNGVFFGAISAHITNIEYTSTFFPFVIGHGSVELTAIVIAGMAGIKLGWALVAPGNLTRMDALKLAAKDAVTLMYGATLFLILAAFIEAFWSSSSTLAISTKYTVGTFLWIFVYVYLLFPRRARHEA
ncbi:stage II sporulation protein M [Pleionea sp. CnH1-48]|uniref:stage II sporulation protein M n=1 Tax=Pleionea sp. CnH1-48 TaxID=2954494 RepID=UPI00209737A9|nr:stage II sporulation protein M [Pleionea sp. CnH1-48]MCO7224678.1 stage II sporulation protein M [Pleionea sp. CnH1-48]